MEKNEELLLKRKTEDLINRSRKNYQVLYSHFLTPAEQQYIENEFRYDPAISFEGGYEGSERKLCKVRTDDYQTDEGLPAVLYHIRATAADAELSHRDVLGALMGLGIKREMLGDIMAKGTDAYVFVHNSVQEFVELNLDKIGRYRIILEQTDTAHLPEPETEAFSVNVSSMRLDCVCGEAFGMSRTKAAEAIKKGLVAVNWVVCEDVSMEITTGDKLSMRTKGKVRVGEVRGLSKKGRIFLELFRYI